MKNIIIGIVAIVIIGLGAWYFMSRDGSGDDIQPGGALVPGQVEVKYTDPRSDEVAVVGEWSCLPLVSGEESTPDNCLLGIKGDDGKFYALDTSKTEIIGKDAASSTKARIVGKKHSGESDLSGVYKYDELILVRVLQAA